MPPKKKTAPRAKAVASPTPLQQSDVASSAPMNTRARVLEMLGATLSTPLSQSDPAPSAVAAGSTAAFRTLKDCSAMLRAVYVVTQTDKAQLKLRPQELSNVPFQPHSHPAQTAPPAPATIGKFGLPAAPVGGVYASPMKTMHTGSGSRPPLPTPPPSPSRFFAPPNSSDFASPTRPPRPPSLGREGGHAHTEMLPAQLTPIPVSATPPSNAFGVPTSESLNMSVIADLRWRNAVSMMMGDAAVTLDHIARLAKLFPTYLKVSLPANSLVERSGVGRSITNGRPASVFRIDEALKQLSDEDTYARGPRRGVLSSVSPFTLPDANSDEDKCDLVARHHDANALLLGRMRVTLLRPDVPSLDSIVADIEERGGTELLRSVDNETALSILASSTPSTTATREGEAEETSRKRLREGTATPAPAPPTAAAIQLPAHLLEVLSETKRLHVTQAAMVEQQSLRDDAAHVLDRRAAWEKMLGLYDLVRICFGAPALDPHTRTMSYRVLGGARLVTLLVAQNRYGCSKEDIALLVQRLLTFPESGLRTSVLTLGGGGDLHGDATPVANAAWTPSQEDAFDSVLFHLSPTASRAKLELALERQAAAVGCS